MAAFCGSRPKLSLSHRESEYCRPSRTKVACSCRLTRITSLLIIAPCACLTLLSTYVYIKTGSPPRRSDPGRRNMDPSAQPGQEVSHTHNHSYRSTSLASEANSEDPALYFTSPFSASEGGFPGHPRRHRSGYFHDSMQPNRNLDTGYFCNRRVLRECFSPRTTVRMSEASWEHVNVLLGKETKHYCRSIQGLIPCYEWTGLFLNIPGVG